MPRGAGAAGGTMIRIPGRLSCDYPAAGPVHRGVESRRRGDRRTGIGGIPHHGRHASRNRASADGGANARARRGAHGHHSRFAPPIQEWESAQMRRLWGSE